MISALLVLGLPKSTPPVDLRSLAASVCTASCSHHAPDGRVGKLVAMAWEEALQGPPPTQQSTTPPAVATPAGATSLQDAAQKKHQEELNNDRELGKKYSEQVDKEMKASENAEMIARVQRIGKELANIANANQFEVTWGDKRLNPFDYTFKVIKEDDVNAFSLPGGYIYIYEGLVKFAESDDELAGVLAHEIAHASFRHVAVLQREQSRLNSISIPLILLAIFTGGAGAGAGALQAGSLIGAATGSGWSIRAEQSADFGGFQYLVDSKYDPTGMLTFMERLAIQEKRRPLGFDLGIYRTHPPSRERADAITRYMKENSLPIKRSRVTTSFRVDVKPADDGTVQIAFGKRPIVSFAGTSALERADLAVKRLNDFFDTVPELFEVQAGFTGTVIGRRQPLFQITKEDAAAAHADVETYQKEVIKNLHLSMFNLAFRVWETKG